MIMASNIVPILASWTKLCWPNIVSVNIGPALGHYVCVPHETTVGPILTHHYMGPGTLYTWHWRITDKTSLQEKGPATPRTKLILDFGWVKFLFSISIKTLISRQTIIKKFLSLDRSLSKLYLVSIQAYVWFEMFFFFLNKYLPEVLNEYLPEVNLTSTCVFTSSVPCYDLGMEMLGLTQAWRLSLGHRRNGKPCSHISANLKFGCS